VEHIKRGILSGEYAKGSTMPTVRDLAAQAGVNPNTMQRALAQLEQEGLLQAQRTSGRVVTSDAHRIEELRQSSARDLVQGFLKGLQDLGLSAQDATALLAEATANINKER
jgi:DNA-binding transcriptional regulator YhcF (GntR family)